MSIALLRTAAVASAATLALVGCTPTPVVPASSGVPSSSGSPTSSVSPTPSPSWTAEQQAAIDAVRGYLTMYVEIGADPSKYSDKQMTTMLKKYIGGDMVPATVSALSYLRKNGWHQAGNITSISTDATNVVDNHNDRGLEVHVTSCLDQTGRKIVDKAGAPAKTEQPPDYNLRQFSVRKPQGSEAWRVFGIATVKGKCGS